ncbi:hypothetical protein [Microvirga sp. VF16]|uniref:hypothetical protein n=1 Tax=Microvirga sp. VF16 TaxID=2807101 RepID=UPI00193E3E15|nr:hypothetical protein [Microvirga sp. VF16]QRM33863.1 hypothetical protein JO965_38520 [Microvirga sp. VF16]
MRKSFQPDSSTEQRNGEDAATIGVSEIEVTARTILRDRIERSPWYPNLSEEDRSERIAHDVECYWPTVINEAARRLNRQRVQQTKRSGF